MEIIKKTKPGRVTVYPRHNNPDTAVPQTKVIHICRLVRRHQNCILTMWPIYATNCKQSDNCGRGSLKDHSFKV